ncbi:MAG TPA: PIG-L family deacetylase [Hanamia sp.]|nr:PIG-L family deacetylase [Hanamia sp.]
MKIMSPFKFLQSGAIAIFLCILLMNTPFAHAQQLEKPRKCIMVFGAHADDVESLAGGTFAKYIAMGYEGVYVGVVNNLAGCSLEKTPYFKGAPAFTVSNSSKSFPVGALETSQIREEEALQAAAVFGATPVFLNYKEPWFSMGRKQIDYGTELYGQYSPPGRPLIALATIMSKEVDLVVDLLRQYKPEIVIIHTLGGEKLDHGNAAYIMYLAFKKAINQKIAVGKLWMPARGWFDEEETRNSKRVKPDVYINVKDFLKIKYEAYDKHLSQNGGFGRDYVISNRRQSYNDETEEFITVIDLTK